MSNTDIVLLVPSLFLTGANLVLITHNAARLSAGDPSGRGGMGGIVAGALGTAYGALCIGYSDRTEIRVAGIGCAAMGVVSLYLGVRSIRASNRKYDEEHGMVIDPILIDDGSGRLGPGVRVSWKF